MLNLSSLPHFEEYDKTLFENMFNSYSKQMLALALSILNNKSDAEDVVHNVFLRIAQKNWSTVRGIQNTTDLRNYLLKATKNNALNQIKSNRKQGISLDTVVEFDLGGKETLSDEDFVFAVCNKMEYEKVVEAIKSLSEIYRDVLYYHFVLELSVGETAEHLGRSVDTTKKQLVRGKRLLLGLLNSKGVEEYAKK